MSPGHRIVKVGLLGLPGAGKSTVARLLQEEGAVVLDADALVVEAYTRPEIQAAVTERFGAGLFDASGALDRRRLARIVFADEPARRELERILHPYVRARMAATVESLPPHAGAIVVIDAPLVAEGKLADDCDAFVFVAASPEARRVRVAARGWDEAELARREAAQLSAAGKRAAAGDRPLWEIPNDGDLEEVAQRVAAVWQEMQSLRKEH